MLENRKVIVRMYFGETHEGVLRKSEIPGFIHLETRINGAAVHQYFSSRDVMSIWYSTGRNTFQVSVERVREYRR